MLKLKRNEDQSISLSSNCPKCGVEVIKDIENLPVAYPYVGRQVEVTFNCGSTEWQALLKLQVKGM